MGDDGYRTVGAVQGGNMVEHTPQQGTALPQGLALVGRTIVTMVVLTAQALRHRYRRTPTPTLRPVPLLPRH